MPACQPAVVAGSISRLQQIDSIDSENVIRFGLRNTLQTRRDGQLRPICSIGT